MAATWNDNNEFEIGRRAMAGFGTAWPALEAKVLQPN